MEMQFADQAIPKGDQVPVLVGPTLKSGVPIAVGVISAGQLSGRETVPWRDTRTKKGYQRVVSKARVNRLKRELQLGRVDLPTSLLLNIRESNSGELLIENGSGVALRLAPELFVVDGQHRTAALCELVEEDPDRWSSFTLPFVCMLGASERQEMEQFYIVNSTAKSVRTDLAYDLLKQRAESDPELARALEETGESWKVRAQTVVERLEVSAPVWQHRIRFPGDEKGITMLGNSGMVNSLKQLMATPYFEAISTDAQVSIIDSYWRGLKQALPECFEDPTEFTIQKATGVTAMHGLLVIAIEHVRARGRDLTDPTSFADVLRDPLLNLQGDSRDGGIAEGAEFWRAGAMGAAGSFSSNAGRRVLLAKLKALLPQMEIE